MPHGVLIRLGDPAVQHHDLDGSADPQRPSVFAQFEREVTSERIRDKIAASKRKGLWVGGNLPLGYEMKDGKIAVVEEEAELVRSIFRRYLELGSVNELLRDLRERNILHQKPEGSRRVRRAAASRSAVARCNYLLSNHFYIGEVKIQERESCRASNLRSWIARCFDAVRQKSLAQCPPHCRTQQIRHLLAGFDCSTTPATAWSQPTPQKLASAIATTCRRLSCMGEAKTAPAGSVSRIPASDIEEAS